MYCCHSGNFYPRPPRGGRLLLLLIILNMKGIFLSTPSARRATLDFWHYADNYKISIHALREEGDVFTIPNVHGDELFLSTPSARRATTASLVWGMPIEISIHALREEGDRNRRNVSNAHQHFYPRPPRGGRLQKALTDVASDTGFLSTPSARRATATQHTSEL